MEELNLMATFKQRQLLHPSHTGQGGAGGAEGGGGEESGELKWTDSASNQL